MVIRLYGCFLSRGPGKLPSAEKVHVKVKNSLSGALIGVKYRPVSAFRYILIFRYLRGNKKHVPDKLFVTFFHFIERGEMFFRYNQNMHRRLRIYILEREYFFILVNFFCINFTFYHLAEQTVHMPTSFTFI